MAFTIIGNDQRETDIMSYATGRAKLFDQTSMSPPNRPKAIRKREREMPSLATHRPHVGKTNGFETENRFFIAFAEWLKERDFLRQLQRNFAGLNPEFRLVRTRQHVPFRYDSIAICAKCRTKGVDLAFLYSEPTGGCMTTVSREVFATGDEGIADVEILRSASGAMSACEHANGDSPPEALQDASGDDTGDAGMSIRKVDYL